MASLFDAAHSGDVAAVRARAAEGLDLNAKDVNGRSALILAVEGGHDEVVSELLARGADRHEALAAGHGQNGSNIAALLNDARLRSQHVAEGEPQHQQQQQQQPPHHHMYAPVPTDIYGGYQLPDGSIAYGGYPQYPPPFQGGAPGQPAFYHDPVMFPHAGASMPPYPFPPMTGGGPRPRGSSSFGQASQGRKPSTVGKLPPPEIAKTIPCRFYPNCRNGASCIFAHVDGHAVPDVSPSVTSPHAPHHPHDGGAPPPPPGYYGIPAPFPPHFYMMPHGSGTNGTGPMPFSGPSGAPMPLHYQPHEAPHPGQMTPLAPMAEAALPAASAPTTAEPEQAVAADEAAVSQPASAPVPVTTSQEDDKSVVGGGDEAAAGDVTDDQDRRRRQSFNTFLHSHAVPFQPAQLTSSVNGATVPIPLGPAAASMHGYGHGQGGFGGRGKLRGRGGGAAGMMGRGKHERSPCTFFARNACKYGSECLFPHILPDGSDARRLPGMIQPRHGQQGQQSDGAGPSSSGASIVNGDAPVKTGNTPRQPAAASVPLGPKLKREAGLPPTPSVEVTSAAQAQESGASKDSKKAQAQALAQSNGVVPSKPSATAMAGAAAAAAAATSAPASSSSSSPSQAQPQASAQQQQQQPSQQQTQQGQQQQPRKANVAKVNGGQSNKKTPIAPAQRMPSGADFPALPGSPNTNTSTGVASQHPPSPAISAPAQQSQPAASPEASDFVPATAAAPPKVNFSAILSAPAPPKKAPAPNATTESPPAATPAETNGDVEAADEKPDEQNNAAPAKEKTASSKSSKQVNGAASGKAWGQQRPQHHHAHQQQALASSKEPVLDADDFQLVKGRNHGKRPTGSSRGGGGSSSFASAAKAAVTA